MLHNYSAKIESSPTEASDLLFELVSDDDRKKYVCRYHGCGKFFRYKSEIVRHTATHSDSRPFMCHYDNCFKAFKRNDALENHIRSSHTKETPFICPFPDCNMKFTTHGSFRYHVLKHSKQSGVETPIHLKEDAVEDASYPKKHFKSNPSESTSSPSDQAQQAQVFQEPIKASSHFEKLGFEGLGDEFYAPPPRFAGQMKWEFVDDEETESTIPKNEEAQQNQLNTVLEENKMLKDKLNTSEKVIKSMQKQISDLLGSLFSYQEQINMGAQQKPQLDKYPLIPLNHEKSLDDPLFDMINYNDNKGAMSPSNNELFGNEPENNTFDTFFSFNREMSSFDF